MTDWRWLHTAESSTNCYTGNLWNGCKGAAECDKCVYDGQSDYSGTYGVTASGSSLTMLFKINNNIGARLYLLKDEDTYETFKLLGNEFTFDIDVSSLGCGINAALYHVGMPADGGKALYGTAGAKWGMGYGDAQCARDLKFVGGKSNAENWKPDNDDPNKNTGVGEKGSCAAEIDIFEGNSISNAFTLHPCPSLNSLCTGDKECGGTYSTTRYGSKGCAPDGADFAPFRRGNTDFYGPSKTVDTTKPFTVVTQFPASGSSLKEVVRFYVQGGKRIDIPPAKTKGLDGITLTEKSYAQQKQVFGEKDDVSQYGGWAGITKAVASPLVLVMSLWDDAYAQMLWLDGQAYPTDKSATSPGVARGTCDSKTGKRTDTRSQQSNAKVVFSNIKFGPVGSTTTFSKASAGSGGDATPASNSSATLTGAPGAKPSTTTQTTMLGTDNSNNRANGGEGGGGSGDGSSGNGGGDSGNGGTGGGGNGGGGGGTPVVDDSKKPAVVGDGGTDKPHQPPCKPRTKKHRKVKKHLANDNNN